MKRILFIFFSILSAGGFAQFETIEEKLKSKPTTEETVLWLSDTAFTFYGNDPDLTQRLAELALEKSQEWQTALGAARAKHVIGVAYWAKGQHEEAMNYYLKALEDYDALENVKGQGIITMNIGIVYISQGQYERGKGYLRKSVPLIEQAQDTVNLGRVLGNLAALYRNSIKDSAFYFYEESLKIKKSKRDSVGIAMIYNNIASLYLDDDMSTDSIPPDPQKVALAYENLQTALNLLKEGESKNLFTTIYANIGKCLLEQGRYDESDMYLRRALDLSIEVNSKWDEQLIYDYLKQLNEKRGNYKEAYFYYQKRVGLEQNLRSAQVSRQIDELNIKYETAKKEQQLAELEKQNAIDRGIRNLLITSTVAVAIIAFVVILYNYQKRKKDKLIAQLQLEKMSEELTSKNKEIASYTMSFLQKNQLMEELKEQINQLKKSSDITTNKELTRINRIVDNTFRSDEEWKTFQITFDQMHDGFFKDLKKAYPDISNAELKLCALLRLNMNLKESAKILGIAADSVKTARYRLRKKLGLKTEDNLIDFLIQFEKPSKIPS